MLVAWSVGPVQDFIRAARRTLDLTEGSQLLSQLAYEAACAAQEEDCQLVLPVVDPRHRLPVDGMPNKLLLRSPGDFAPVAEVMKAKIDTWLRRRCAEHFQGLPIERDQAEAQVLDLPEVSWAAVVETSDFKADRQRVERLMASAKAERSFRQPSWASAAPKSSIDGAREVVHRKGELHRHGVLPNEHLDGVALLKRLAGRQERRIPSVSAFAAGAWARRAPDEDRLHSALGEYRRQIEDLCGEDYRGPEAPTLGDVDPHLLYDSRLPDLLGSAQGAKTLAKAQRLLGDFYFQVGAGRPSPYYALLLADGDKMGAVLDGAETKDDLQRVARALDGFAQAAPELIERHYGKVIYAGGDDVLALLPLDTLLEAAGALREAYATRVTQWFNATTLSIGLAVVHHLSPLAECLDHVRAAERHAKKERNSWALHRHARSGAPVKATAKWTEEGNGFGPFATLVERLRRDGEASLPRGLPYDLRTAADRLAGPKDLPVPRVLAEVELKRILVQKNLHPEALALPPGESSTLRSLADELILARALTTAQETR